MCLFRSLKFRMIMGEVFFHKNVAIENFLLPRDPDEVDEKVLSLCDKVSKHFFGGEVKPKKEDIFGGYGDIVGDVVFNAIGSITVRNIAKKARIFEPYLN